MLVSPSALRVTPSTMKTLVNEVVSSSTAGATDSSVRPSTMTSEVAGLLPSGFVPLMLKLIEPPPLGATDGATGGAGGVGAAVAGLGDSASTKPTNRAAKKRRMSVPRRPVAQDVQGRTPGPGGEHRALQLVGAEVHGVPVLDVRLLPERLELGLAQQTHLLIRHAQHERPVGHLNDGHRRTPAELLPVQHGQRARPAVAAERAASHLGQPPHQTEHDQQREADPQDEFDQFGYSRSLPGATISVIRMPKFSSITTTSPRAINRPLTSRSAGLPAARSSSTMAPGLSDSSSRTLIRVRPSSADTSISTSCSMSRPPRTPAPLPPRVATPAGAASAGHGLSASATTARTSAPSSNGTATAWSLAAMALSATTGSISCPGSRTTGPKTRPAASSAGRTAAVRSSSPSGLSLSASARSCPTTTTTSPAAAPLNRAVIAWPWVNASAVAGTGAPTVSSRLVGSTARAASAALRARAS